MKKSDTQEAIVLLWCGVSNQINQMGTGVQSSKHNTLYILWIGPKTKNNRPLKKKD